MKILWLNHRDMKHPQAGGAEETIRKVSKVLISKRNQITLVSGGWKGSQKKEILYDISVNRFGRRILPHFAVPLRLIDVKHYDVIIDDLAQAAPFASSFFTHKPGTVFFHHLHSRTLPGQVSYPMFKFLEFIEKRYPNIYRTWPFVTESKQAAQDLENMGISTEKIERIPPGVDTNFFGLLEKYETPTVIYFGGFRDYKRPEDVVYAFDEIKKEIGDARLIMAGDGPSWRRVKSLAERSGSKDSIQFVGRLSKEALSDAVSRSWVNVHTSVAEGWGFSIMEAAASGTPTVGYRVPGVSESVRDGINGLLVNDGSRSDLAKSIVDLLKGSPAMVKSSRKYAEKFSWESTGKKWETHLKKVADGFYV